MSGLRAIAVSILAVLLATSCSVSIETARKWVIDRRGETTIDIDGAWHSNDWGDAYIIQKGNIITGMMGSYAIEGTIKGDMVHAIVTSHGSFYYSFVLKSHKEALIGKYSSSIPEDASMKDVSWSAVMFIRKK